jgi:hypothetical protein
MLSRRELLAGAVAGGGGVAAADAEQPSDHYLQEISQALKDFRSSMDAQRNFPEIQRVRARQIDFLRAQGKFPDFMELGVEAWFAVYDWHVRHLQPIALGRDPNGRYTLVLLATTLILRVDADPNFLGVPYDAR